MFSLFVSFFCIFDSLIYLVVLLKQVEVDGRFRSGQLFLSRLMFFLSTGIWLKSRMEARRYGL